MTTKDQSQPYVVAKEKLVALYRKYDNQDTLFLGIVEGRYAIDLLADLGSLHGRPKDYWIERINSDQQEQMTEGIEKFFDEKK